MNYRKVRMESSLKILILAISLFVLAIGLIAGFIITRNNTILPNYGYVVEKKIAHDSEDEGFFDDVVNYPSIFVSPETDQLEITLNLPEDQKFNKQAPYESVIESDNESVVKIEAYTILKARKVMRIPVVVHDGSTIITIIVDFSYCGMADESLCYFRKIKLEIPVVVGSEGDSLMQIEYTLEH